MTKPLPFTKASLKRAIHAAQEAGLRVTGIRPDGTIEVAGGHVPQHPPYPPADDAVWSDVEA